MSAAVDAKLKEIIADLAKSTGVSADDAEKIIRHLGIEGALKNREAKNDLDRIDLKGLRIAAGAGPI